MPSGDGGDTITISDIVAEFDDLNTPETPAHELWLGANWVNDQLDIDLANEGLTRMNQEVMVVEEAKEGGYIEIHHTHPRPIPAHLKAVIPQTHCEIVGSESRLHTDRNIVHTIVWIVPESLADQWKQPEPNFDQYESFDEHDGDIVVGDSDEIDAPHNDESNPESQPNLEDQNYERKTRDRTGIRLTSLSQAGWWLIIGGVTLSVSAFFVNMSIGHGGIDEGLQIATHFVSLADTFASVMIIAGIFATMTGYILN